MMQKEQCITEAAWILKVILHSAANRFQIVVGNLAPPFVLLLPTWKFSLQTSTVHSGSLPGWADSTIVILGFFRVSSLATQTQNTWNKAASRARTTHSTKGILVHSCSQTCVSLQKVHLF